MEYKEKPEDHNTQPVGLGNTSILTDYAQKSPRTAPSERQVLGCGAGISTMINATNPPTKQQQMYNTLHFHTMTYRASFPCPSQQPIHWLP